MSYEGIRKAPETARSLALSIVEQIRSRFSMSLPSLSASAQDLALPQKQTSCDSVRLGFLGEGLRPAGGLPQHVPDEPDCEEAERKGRLHAERKLDALQQPGAPLDNLRQGVNFSADGGGIAHRSRDCRSRKGAHLQGRGEGFPVKVFESSSSHGHFSLRRRSAKNLIQRSQLQQHDKRKT